MPVLAHCDFLCYDNDKYLKVLRLSETGDCMNGIRFHDLADYLRQGREIEFTYRGREYSITNHSGFWYLCDDTDHVLLETVCRFDEKETLVSRIAAVTIEKLPIQQIFDGQLYDTEKLCIL